MLELLWDRRYCKKKCVYIRIWSEMTGQMNEYKLYNKRGVEDFDKHHVILKSRI